MEIKNKLQYYRDKLKGQFRHRWISTFILACFYAIRVYFHGYALVNFFLGLSLSGFTTLFSSSIIHHDDPDSSEAPPILPIKESDELLVPYITEFGFWCIVNMLFCVALSLTFIDKLNAHKPADPNWYILLFVVWIYFTLMILLELRDSMKNYKYFPFYYGDKKQGLLEVIMEIYLSKKKVDMEIKNKLQYYKDKLKGQFRHRWISTFILACFYAIRVYLYGYCIVTFSLGIFLSGFTIVFLSSIIRPDHPDPDPPVSSDAPPILPIKASDELRPFVPFLHEFTFWCIVNMIFCVALSLTFIPKLNPHIPGFGYLYFAGWLWLTLILVFDRLVHVKKYKYIPFYYGDKKQGEYKGK